MEILMFVNNYKKRGINNQFDQKQYDSLQSVFQKVLNSGLTFLVSIVESTNT